MSSPSLSMTFLLFFSSVSVKTYALWLDIFNDTGYRILIRDKLINFASRASVYTILPMLAQNASGIFHFLLVGEVPNPLRTPHSVSSYVSIISCLLLNITSI